jgi:hypothetical protein
MSEKVCSFKNQALGHTKVLFLWSLYFVGSMYLLIRGICLVLYSLVLIYHHWGWFCCSSAFQIMPFIFDKNSLVILCTWVKHCKSYKVNFADIMVLCYIKFLGFISQVLKFLCSTYVCIWIEVVSLNGPHSWPFQNWLYLKLYSVLCVHMWPPLWSNDQSLATDPEVWVRFLALPDFQRSSGSGAGSTHPHEYNWGATWKK